MMYIYMCVCVKAALVHIECIYKYICTGIIFLVNTIKCKELMPNFHIFLLCNFSACLAT
jgi:hypothetical protein